MNVDKLIIEGFKECRKSIFWLRVAVAGLAVGLYLQRKEIEELKGTKGE